MSQKPGILADRAIASLFDNGNLIAAAPRDHDQIQPASLDLRLGAKAYRVRLANELENHKRLSHSIGVCSQPPPKTQRPPPRSINTKGTTHKNVRYRS